MLKKKKKTLSLPAFSNLGLPPLLFSSSFLAFEKRKRQGGATAIPTKKVGIVLYLKRLFPEILKNTTFIVLREPK